VSDGLRYDCRAGGIIMSTGLLAGLSIVLGLIGVGLNLLYSEDKIFTSHRAHQDGTPAFHLREGVYHDEVRHFMISKSVAWALIGAAAMGLVQLLSRSS
jgi:hypothetical protein